MKDESRIVSKHHFVLDIMQSTLTTRQVMLLIKSTANLSGRRQNSHIDLVSMSQSSLPASYYAPHLLPGAIIYFWILPRVANSLKDGGFSCIRSSYNEDSEAIESLS